MHKQMEVELNFGRGHGYVLGKIPKEDQGRVQHIEKVGEMMVEEPLKTLRVSGYAVLLKEESGKTTASLMIIDSLGRKYLDRMPALTECTPEEGLGFCKKEWRKFEEKPEELKIDSRFWERVGSGWPRITRS